MWGPCAGGEGALGRGIIHVFKPRFSDSPPQPTPSPTPLNFIHPNIAKPHQDISKTLQYHHCFENFIFRLMAHKRPHWRRIRSPCQVSDRAKRCRATRIPPVESLPILESEHPETHMFPLLSNPKRRVLLQFRRADPPGSLASHSASPT